MVTKYSLAAYVLLGVVASSLVVDTSVAMAQEVATKRPVEDADNSELNKRIEGFMKLGQGAHIIKEKDGKITHILLIGEAPLRKSLGAAGITTATQRATDFATGQLPLFIEQKVTAYSGSDGESIVLTEGDADGVSTENGKVIEKTAEWVKRQSEAMIKGIQIFSKTVEKEKVIIGLLWTAKAAAQTNDVSKDNGPPPKVRPGQGTEPVEGTVVNPDAKELLK